MTTPFALINMRPQLPLFLPQRSLLLTPHSPARHNHHNGLIPLLLPIRRTALDLLILLALAASELLSTLAAFADRGHAFFVVCFGLFARSEDVGFGQEGIVFPCRGFTGCFKGSKFSFKRLCACAGLNGIGGGFDTEIVEKSEIRGREDLGTLSNHAT